ncbi:ribosome biogenesis protein Nop16 [Cooperia oncophora]
MVKKKGKKFRPNLKHLAKKRKALEKNKKKCQSTVKVIKENWESTKTPRENALSMGLAYNPNEAVPIVQPHRDIIDMVTIEDMDLAEARALGTVAEQRLKKQQEKNAVLTKEKAIKVVSTLETEAAEQRTLRESSVRTVRLPDRDVELLIYLSERYGDDYKAMAEIRKDLFSSIYT